MKKEKDLNCNAYLLCLLLDNIPEAIQEILFVRKGIPPTQSHWHTNFIGTHHVICIFFEMIYVCTAVFIKKSTSNFQSVAEILK